MSINAQDIPIFSPDRQIFHWREGHQFHNYILEKAELVGPQSTLYCIKHVVSRDPDDNTVTLTEEPDEALQGVYTLPVALTLLTSAAAFVDAKLEQEAMNDELFEAQ